MRAELTSRQVLNDHGGRGVEDDVGAVVEVMQVVATVEASVAKDVVQQQLLKTKRRRQKTVTVKWCISGRMEEARTHLHHFLLLGHIVPQQFVGQRSSSTHRRSEWKTG